MKILGHTTTGGVIIELGAGLIAAFQDLERAALAYAGQLELSEGAATTTGGSITLPIAGRAPKAAAKAQPLCVDCQLPYTRTSNVQKRCPTCRDAAKQTKIPEKKKSAGSRVNPHQPTANCKKCRVAKTADSFYTHNGKPVGGLCKKCLREKINAGKGKPSTPAGETSISARPEARTSSPVSTSSQREATPPKLIATIRGVKQTEGGLSTAEAIKRVRDLWSTAGKWPDVDTAALAAAVDAEQ
jgi:hypothetical protein